MGTDLRPTFAEIDLRAIENNVRTMVDRAAPAEVCAVVKAFAYGHGPIRVAEAALRGGATSLAVALVEEGQQLRNAGITEPILVLSEPPPSAMADVVIHDLTPTLYTLGGVEALAKAVALTHPHESVGVHLKVDTGMNRVGVRWDEAAPLVGAINGHQELSLAGVFTHFANADDPNDEFTTIQLNRFTLFLNELKARGFEPGVVHAANSGATLAFPDARYDMVRCGIALYGVAPSPALANAMDYHPALSFKSAVSYVKRARAGEGFSYGQLYTTDHDTNVASVPVGYADGLPRNYGLSGGEVLIRGQRCRVAGTVTMDQMVVDCGDLDVAVGDEVVLLGRQGDQHIDAWEWANRLGTIGYEVICGISSRVPRRYTLSGAR